MLPELYEWRNLSTRNTSLSNVQINRCENMRKVSLFPQISIQLPLSKLCNLFSYMNIKIKFKHSKGRQKPNH